MIGRVAGNVFCAVCWMRLLSAASISLANGTHEVPTQYEFRSEVSEEVCGRLRFEFGLDADDDCGNLRRGTRLFEQNEGLASTVSGVYLIADHTSNACSLNYVLETEHDRLVLLNIPTNGDVTKLERIYIDPLGGVHVDPRLCVGSAEQRTYYERVGSRMVETEQFSEPTCGVLFGDEIEIALDLPCNEPSP